MYKRKNWLMDRGAEGGSSSEDEEDLDNSQEQDSSEEVIDEDAASSEASESEDDYKGDQEECQEEQLQEKTTVKEMSMKKMVKLCLKSDENELFDRQIYCSCCKKCQITDSQTLRKHIQSKKHVKRVEKAGLEIWESLQWVTDQFQDNLESQQTKQSKRIKNKTQKQDGINKMLQQDVKIKKSNQDEKLVKKQSRKARRTELQNDKQSYPSNKGKSKRFKQK